MADTPKAYKLNKEKRAAEENGKFLYYFYDRKKLTSVALPEDGNIEQFHVRAFKSGGKADDGIPLSILCKHGW